MHHRKVPQGRLKKLSRRDPEFGQRIGNLNHRIVRDRSALGSPPGNFQSSLRDFSSLESLPRTASWAKVSRPCGTRNSRILRFESIRRLSNVEALPQTRVQETRVPRRGSIQPQMRGLRAAEWEQRKWGDEGGRSAAKRCRSPQGEMHR
jgi:hypothetical protein